MDSKILKILNKISPYLSLILFFSVFVFTVVFFDTRDYLSGKRNKVPQSLPEEIVQIKNTTINSEKVETYTKLIERVGVVEAQEILFKSGLPFDGETHLLNHVAGDYIYSKYGYSGLKYCKDYFLSSCYHGFLLNVIAEGGMPLVAKTFDECFLAGPTTYYQCAHGIGHGFLANAGYKNVDKALKTCDEAEKKIKNFPVYNCYDGVFMENIWAVHDGKPSPDRWVKENDIFYPCNDERLDKKYILACWSNQPSLVYQQFKGDIKRVAYELCNNVKDTEFQRMCFDGLARQIHPLTGGEVAETIRYCRMMPSIQWNNFCVSTNAGSSYSVGDRSLPFEICLEAREDGKKQCFDHLIGVIKVYSEKGENSKLICDKIKDRVWKKYCQDSLS